MPDRWVIKLGGSLFGNPLLSDWLSTISRHGKGRVVIVPGGGLFADTVRLAQKQAGFDDVTAHRMALLAMEQFGIMLAGLNPDLIPAKNRNEIDALLKAKQLAVWLPSEMLPADARVPASWDVTSDSLAAWLAAQIGATDLLLVKSGDLPHERMKLEELARLGIVDPLFPHYAKCGLFRTAVLSAGDYKALQKMLAQTEKDL